MRERVKLNDSNYNNIEILITILHQQTFLSLCQGRHLFSLNSYVSGLISAFQLHHETSFMVPYVYITTEDSHVYQTEVQSDVRKWFSSSFEDLVYKNIL